MTVVHWLLFLGLLLINTPSIVAEDGVLIVEDGDSIPFPASVEPPTRAHLSIAQRLAEHERLKREIHTLPTAEAERRFRKLPRVPTPPRQDKVDHFVVLYMENHAAVSTEICITHIQTSRRTHSRNKFHPLLYFFVH